MDYPESTVSNFVGVSFVYKELNVLLVHVRVKVKSGKIGHQVNSDTHLQRLEIQMR